MSEEIIPRQYLENKIDRAINAGEPCPFPPGSYWATMFHQRASQPNHAPANPGRVDLAQGA